jgi:hypothetical protein
VISKNAHWCEPVAKFNVNPTRPRTQTQRERELKLNASLNSDPKYEIRRTNAHICARVRVLAIQTRTKPPQTRIFDSWTRFPVAKRAFRCLKRELQKRISSPQARTLNCSANSRFKCTPKSVNFTAIAPQSSKKLDHKNFWRLKRGFLAP